MAPATTALPNRDPMGLDEDGEEDVEPLAVDGHYREQIYVYSVLCERFAVRKAPLIPPSPSTMSD